MIQEIIEMMSYPFMTRAFLVGSLVALCSALLGVSLVLKRYSMIGDGLSHVGFGAMAIAAAMNAAPLAVAIPIESWRQSCFCGSTVMRRSKAMQRSH